MHRHTNVEIKARVRAPDRLRELATQLSGRPVETLEQTDTYFAVPRGRLKLRESPGNDQLIYYERPNQTGPKCSAYQRVLTADAAGLRALLTAAFGLRGIVRKTRQLFQVGRTRIHLDEVRDLGWFMELEVVLSPGQSAEYGRGVAGELMKQLEIEERDLIADSYIDLLCRGGRAQV